MDRKVFWAILLTWLVVSFVPALSAAALLRLGKARGQGGG